MAGVGRRGFAAAARAALFTNAMGGGSMGMQDRRGPFLDMDAAIAISSEWIYLSSLSFYSWFGSSSTMETLCFRVLVFGW